MNDYQQLSRDVVQVVNGASKLLGNLCDASSSSNTQDAQLGPWWQKHAAIRSRHGNQRLEVAVLALTKSGEPSMSFCMRSLWKPVARQPCQSVEQTSYQNRLLACVTKGFGCSLEHGTLPEAKGPQA